MTNKVILILILILILIFKVGRANVMKKADRVTAAFCLRLETDQRSKWFQASVWNMEYWILDTLIKSVGSHIDLLKKHYLSRLNVPNCFHLFKGSLVYPNCTLLFNSNLMAPNWRFSTIDTQLLVSSRKMHIHFIWIFIDFLSALWILNTIAREKINNIWA